MGGVQLQGVGQAGDGDGGIGQREASAPGGFGAARDGSAGRRSTVRTVICSRQGTAASATCARRDCTFMASVEMARSSVCGGERVVGLDARFVVFAAADHGGGKAGMPVFQNDVRLFESHGGRIGNGERGVVEGQRALQTSLPRVADGAIHGAGKLQLGRELRAHVARQFQDGRHGKAIPVEADGPVRLREVIGGAEVHGQRQGCVARGSGMQFQLLIDQVEAAADFQRPALAVAGHHVPAVHIADIEAAGDAHVAAAARPGAGANSACRARRRPGRSSSAVTSPSAARSTSMSRSTRPGIGIPAALQAKRSQALRRRGRCARAWRNSRPSNRRRDRTEKRRDRSR